MLKDPSDFWLNPIILFIIISIISIIPTYFITKFCPKYDKLMQMVSFWFYIICAGILGYILLDTFLSCAHVGGGSGMVFLVYALIASAIHVLFIIPIASCLICIKPLNITTNSILRIILRNLSIAFIIPSIVFLIIFLITVGALAIAFILSYFGL